MGDKKILADGTVPEVGMMVTRAYDTTDDTIWLYYLGTGEITKLDMYGCDIRCIEVAGENGKNYECAVSNMERFYVSYGMLRRCENQPQIQFDEAVFLSLLN